MKDILEQLQRIHADLKLELNSKTQIVPFRKGIKYLGFHHYVTADGKYIRKLTGDKKRSMRKKLKKKAALVRAGKMPEEKFMESYNSWKAHVKNGNCVKLCSSMDRYVEELLNEL